MNDSAPDPGPVRFSHLRAYGRSGAHGYHARFGVEGKNTYAMERGTAAHALLFGNKRVCGYPGSVRRGKEYEAFAAEHADYEILTMVEYDKARRIADAVRACELAQPVLKGTTEQTLFFRWMGLDCRVTPDIRGADFITELKTTANSDPERFVWDALRRHYHAQLRFQMMGCHSRLHPVQDCYIVAVESAEPFPVTVFHVEPRALEIGERTLMLWAERLKNCETSCMWPPYVTSMMPLDVPDEAGLEFGDEEDVSDTGSLAERELLASQI